MGPEKEFDAVSRKTMAFSVIKGGLEALHKLGSTDVHGVSRRTGNRSWSTNDNGNPANMLRFVRDLMGEDDDILFTIERDINRNVVVYRPSLTPRGELDTSSLAKGSWLLVPEEVDLDNTTVEMVEEELVEEEFTALEQMGYGVDMVHQDDLCFAVRALPDNHLHLFQTPAGKWRARLLVEGKLWTLQRILLHTTPRALGLFPAVSELHVEVEDAATGAVAQFYYAAN